MQRVLAISRKDIASIIPAIPKKFSQFVTPTKAYGEIPPAFYNLTTELVRQEICEAGMEYLQLVPYVQIIDTKSLNVYLHRYRVCMFSTGISSFIERRPSEKGSLKLLIAEEIIRMIGEELRVQIDEDDLDMIIHSLDNNSAFIYDDELLITASHIGICIPVFISSSKVNLKNENETERGHWESIKSVAEQHLSGRIRLETWSIIAINALIDRFNSATEERGLDDSPGNTA